VRNHGKASSRATFLYRAEALDLAARYALVKTLLGWICVGPTATIQYAKEAVALSNETGDISLQLSALSKLAWAYFYTKNYKPALTIANQAETLLQSYYQGPTPDIFKQVLQRENAAPEARFFAYYGLITLYTMEISYVDAPYEIPLLFDQLESDASRMPPTHWVHEEVALLKPWSIINDPAKAKARRQRQHQAAQEIMNRYREG
jgi:hypothetical protein